MGGESQAVIQRPLARTDDRGPLRAQKNIPVPVAPVPGVGREKAGGDTQLLHPGDLVFATHLRMHQDHPRVRYRVLALGRLEGVQDILYGFIAVAMDGYLVARLVQGGHLGKQFLPGNRGIAAVLGIAVIGGVIGMTEIACVALYATVGDQLDRAHDYPVSGVVGGVVAAVVEFLAKLGFEGEQDQALGNDTQLAEQGQAGGQFGRHATGLGGGHTDGGVFIGRRLHEPIGIEQADVLHRYHERQARGLFQQAVGLRGAGQAADDPALRVGRFGVDPDGFQGKGIRHHHMPGHMGGDHRVLGGNRIQFGAGGVPLLGQQGIVVVEAEYPVAGRRDGRLLRERRQHLCHGSELPHRRAVEVRPQHPHTRVGKVAVGIDKARQHGAAAQVGYQRVILYQGHDLIGAAHRLDTVTAHRDGLHHAIVRVHGQQRPVDEHLVRRGLWQPRAQAQDDPEADQQRQRHHHNGFPLHKQTPSRAPIGACQAKAPMTISASRDRCQAASPNNS